MTHTNYDTVTEAMAGLKLAGYTADFSLLSDQDCRASNFSARVLSPDDFEIDHFYRFEGNSDPGDEMIVYAISALKGSLKGVIVSAYGRHACSASSTLIERLSTHSQ